MNNLCHPTINCQYWSNVFMRHQIEGILCEQFYLITVYRVKFRGSCRLYKALLLKVEFWAL
jgi:hypothetical protein